MKQIFKTLILSLSLGACTGAANKPLEDVLDNSGSGDERVTIELSLETVDVDSTMLAYASTQTDELNAILSKTDGHLQIQLDVYNGNKASFKVERVVFGAVIEASDFNQDVLNSWLINEMIVSNQDTFEKTYGRGGLLFPLGAHFGAISVGIKSLSKISIDQYPSAVLLTVTHIGDAGVPDPIDLRPK